MNTSSKEEIMVAFPMKSQTVFFNNELSKRNICISTNQVRERPLVCVTSGNSYFGFHLVKKLLARGYLVRTTVQYPVSRKLEKHACSQKKGRALNTDSVSPMFRGGPGASRPRLAGALAKHVENFEDLKAIFSEKEANLLESVVIGKMNNFDSLCEAFRGCDVVFHTSSFIDPHGVSGYKENMAFIEMEGAKNVIEACARSARVKRCVFTSSLLACIWNSNNFDKVINESCWSDEDFCRENKLWLALGKTRAEKAAWLKSIELKVKLVTVCSGLLMAPSFPNPHVATSVPYLKGGQEMLQRGLLAYQDVESLADIHIHIYESLDYEACGRYLCFEKVVQKLNIAIQLENRLKIPGLLTELRNSNAILDGVDNEIPSKLCNSKVAKLLLNASRRLSCKQQDML